MYMQRQVHKYLHMMKTKFEFNIKNQARYAKKHYSARASRTCWRREIISAASSVHNPSIPRRATLLNKAIFLISLSPPPADSRSCLRCSARATTELGSPAAWAQRPLSLATPG
eukprot:16317_6